MQHRLPEGCIQWLDNGGTDPVDSEWVPGANVSELTSLARLGGIARILLRGFDYSGLPSQLRSWLDNSPTPPELIASEVAEVFDRDPDALLAELYRRLVSPSHRRNLGTFFTPALEVELMLDLWDESQPEPKTVVDVGAGVGVFTASAAQRWSSANVLAIDVNPITLGLLAVRLFATNKSRSLFGKRVQLVLQDFTAWIQDGQYQPGGRLILGNPPYTRSQLLPRSERARLMEAAQGLCGSRASLSTYISAISFLELQPTDGLCLLLPAQWLETDYASNFRNELWRSTRRRLDLRLVDSKMFEDANVDAVALLVGVQEAPALMSVGRWREDTLKDIDRDLSFVPRSWRKLFDPAEQINPRSLVKEKTLHAIAHVRRGVATGANVFFLPTRADAESLPPVVLHPVATKLINLPDTLRIGAVIDESGLRTLFACSESDMRRSAEVRKYVTRGEEQGWSAGHLCQQRAVWYDLRSEVIVPDVIVGSMTRDRFKFVKNEIGATITNNLFGVIWREETPDADRALVLSWLRSNAGQQALRRVARRQGNGLLKLEPRALREMTIPNFESIPN